MKRLKYIFCFALIAPAMLCQSFLIHKADTINRVDKENKKQGIWIWFSSSPKCNTDGLIIEKGIYNNNKKNGVWEEFYCSGVTKTKITFINGRPEGIVSIFYENGNLHETGIWKNNKWVGKYKEFDIAGKFIREQELDSLGRKEGRPIFNFKEYEPFLINGEAVLYNTKNQILKEGVFKDSRLLDGKFYIYDEKGELSRTTVYMSGVYVGDTQK